MKCLIHNAKFTNKATPSLTEVTTKTVQTQHHIDLVDLSKEAVEHEGLVYKYVLTVMEVFNRYLWLCPLEKNSSSHVA